MDQELKKQASLIFKRMGLSEEEAVTLFYKRTVAAGKMPFSASAAGDTEKIKKKRMNERFAEWDAF